MHDDGALIMLTHFLKDVLTDHLQAANHHRIANGVTKSCLRHRHLVKEKCLLNLLTEADGAAGFVIVIAMSTTSISWGIVPR